MSIVDQKLLTETKTHLRVEAINIVGMASILHNGLIDPAIPNAMENIHLHGIITEKNYLQETEAGIETEVETEVEIEAETEVETGVETEAETGFILEAGVVTGVVQTKSYGTKLEIGTAVNVGMVHTLEIESAPQ